MESQDLQMPVEAGNGCENNEANEQWQTKVKVEPNSDDTPTNNADHENEEQDDQNGDECTDEQTEQIAIKPDPDEPLYIAVAEGENDEPIELPCEDQNSILLSTLSSQFPGASGLKYRNPNSKAMRGLRLVDGCLIAPEKGWAAYSTYYCVFPRDNKRKQDDDEVGATRSRKHADSYSRCSDLIVLGLPWKITEKELRMYFEQFGDVEMVQIKRDAKTGQSKGFGFVKFTDYDVQMRAVSSRHNIQGRWCDVRVPLSKGEEQFSYANSEFNRKIFVGRITDDFTVEDLRGYFKKFGEISDVFIPKPFRGFAFVTFKENEVAQSLCGEEHVIKGVSTQVSNAVPKVDFNAGGSSGGGYGGGGHGYGAYGGGGMHQHGSNGHHHNGYHGGHHGMGNGGPPHGGSRYNPYNAYDARRPPHRPAAFGVSNGNPLVNSTYNNPAAGSAGSTNSGSTPPANGGWGSGMAAGPPRNEMMGGISGLSGMPPAGTGYGMSAYGPQSSHYSRH